MHDAHCFRSQFHQDLFEEYVASKSVIPETSFDLQEDETKEEIASGEAYPYKSYVRGVTIDFSAANIREILKIRDNTPGAKTDFNTRQGEDQRLDEVIQYICVPGARWKMSSSQPNQLIQLKRQDLTPLARGWAEFIIHSIIPTGNKSEITVARATLQGSRVSFREFRGNEYIAIDKPITGRVMVRTRGRNVNLQPNQLVEEEDQPKPTHQDWAEDEQHQDHKQPH
ncbi:hypothetical protein PIB30_055061 [Stylosanthes scabra]|uniref:Putative plant transposon protein domain-containing protein n=1 Tax=Stylosanthes scabra TaxID=79078 RepID=A0ABU6XJ87_9FABA|nr:hypothetical protein [Stylosanthes scabra]